MRERLLPMGLRGAMTVPTMPPYLELAHRIGLERMGHAIQQLHSGNVQFSNVQFGTNVTTFWLHGPQAISAVEQTHVLSGLAHRFLPLPRKAQDHVAEIPRVNAGPGWSLHAEDSDWDTFSHTLEGTRG